VGGIGGPLVKGLAFVFPGQGAQVPGMGQELARAFPESRAVFDEADDVLGFAISRLCFSGSEADLALTENTQPAILTVSIAATRALAARGIAPEAVAGHSLGEYSAHVCAGTMSFADAVRTVRSRGRFMQEAVPIGVGAMAAVLGLAPEEVERVCRESASGEVVSPANLNAPDQVVIAGHASAIERAVAASREAGAKKVVPLSVSAPFHCALMAPAALRLADVLRGIRFEDPEVPVVTNVDARPVTSGAAARDALVRQVASPVRWHEVVEALARSGIGTFVEPGPGRVLSGLVRRIHKAARVFPVGTPGDVEGAARELGAVA
jgi:[acyl-carrier-protein] S-malonyltransferase